MKPLENTKINRQRGSALIVSLIILLILTIVGVQGMRTTTLEEKMAGNYLDNQVAFEAAEHALLEADRWLTVKTSAPIDDDTGSNGVWNSGVPKPYDDSWWANAVSAGSDINGLSGNTLSAQPKYYIEQKQIVKNSAEIGSLAQPPTYYYQVTARGQGGVSSSVVLLQLSYAMKF